jgi:hypothetical protein
MLFSVNLLGPSMVSSRRANRAVRSSIDLKKTMAVWHVLRWILVWVVCLCVCGGVGGGGGGDLDRLTKMQSCVPMEKKGNAFSFARVVTNVLENNGRATGIFCSKILPFVFLFDCHEAASTAPSAPPHHHQWPRPNAAAAASRSSSRRARRQCRAHGIAVTICVFNPLHWVRQFLPKGRTP